jgi:osmotically-inducible protein OsmY
MSTDHNLKAEVLAELAWEPMVSADPISVTARDGMVTLEGHTESFWQKCAVEEAVARVKGVKGITDKLKVLLPDASRRSDDEISTAALARIGSDNSVPDGVRVRVENGIVTLTGTVSYHYQSLAAARAVHPLGGVTGVVNDIAVLGTQKKPANPNQIADIIRRALNRGWFAADTVHVATSDGTVTLSGRAETLRDRTLAVETAWSAPGTVVVENHIRIG